MMVNSPRELGKALRELRRGSSEELLVNLRQLSAQHNWSFTKYIAGLPQCCLNSMRRLEEGERVWRLGDLRKPLYSVVQPTAVRSRTL